MEKMKKLPNTEFDVMAVIWELEAPIAANTVLKYSDKKYKIQTLITVMMRLVNKGFLRTEKIGKDRVYYPIVNKEDYLKFETNSFIRQYHKNSLLNLVNTLNDAETLTDEDIAGLVQWVKERGK